MSKRCDWVIAAVVIVLAALCIAGRMAVFPSQPPWPVVGDQK